MMADKLLRQIDRDRLEFLKTQGLPRSDKWPALRKKFLARHPTCGVCGGKTKLQAHHILPFHLFPTLELKESNLYPLCEGNKTINCHLRFGHFDNFATKYNKDIRTDASKWLKRFLAKKMPV